MRPERLNDFHDGGEFRPPVRRQRLVKALAPKPGRARDRGHALGTRDVAERGSDQRRVAVLERRVEVGRDVGVALEVLGRIPDARLDGGFLRLLCLWSSGLPDGSGQGERGTNVGRLRALVAATEKDDQRFAAPDEIDAISRSVVDPQFGDAFADRFVSPGLPSDRWRMRIRMRARASRFFSRANQPA